MPTDITKGSEETETEIALRILLMEGMRAYCYDIYEDATQRLDSVTTSLLTIKEAKKLLIKSTGDLVALKKYISGLDKAIQGIGETLGAHKIPSLSNDLNWSLSIKYEQVFSELHAADEKGYGNKICIDFFHPEKVADTRRYVV